MIITASHPIWLYGVPTYVCFYLLFLFLLKHLQTSAAHDFHGRSSVAVSSPQGSRVKGLCTALRDVFCLHDGSPNTNPTTYLLNYVPGWDALSGDYAAAVLRSGIVIVTFRVHRVCVIHT